MNVVANTCRLTSEISRLLLMWSSGISWFVAPFGHFNCPRVALTARIVLTGVIRYNSAHGKSCTNFDVLY